MDPLETEGQDVKKSRTNGKRKILGLSLVPKTYDIYGVEVNNISQQAPFKITKLFSPENSRRHIKDHSYAKIIQLDNIPESWTLENLATLFDNLGELANYKYQTKGVEAVKAILEIGLTMEPTHINLAYKFKEPKGKTSVDGNHQQPKLFTNRFLDYTSGKHANFRFFYERVFGMNPSAVRTYSDAARLLISWFTSYLLGNAFVDRPDFKKSETTSHSLAPICVSKELPDVFSYYTDVLQNHVENYAQLNMCQFFQAKFLANITRAPSGNDTNSFSLNAVSSLQTSNVDTTVIDSPSIPDATPAPPNYEIQNDCLNAVTNITMVDSETNLEDDSTMEFRWSREIQEDSFYGLDKIQNTSVGESSGLHETTDRPLSSKLDSTSKTNISKPPRTVWKQNTLAFQILPKTYNIHVTESGQIEHQQDFKITKLISPTKSRCFIKDYSRAHLVQLDAIPETWSLESLASLFDTLGELSNVKYQPKGISVVKAILEIGLTMAPEDMNFVFKNEEVKNLQRGRPTSFTNRFLDHTTGRHQNFRYFYENTFGKTLKASKRFGDVTKKLISWFAAYLLINAYVDRPGYPTSQLQSNGSIPICVLRELPDVCSYYTEFLQNGLETYVKFNIREFLDAKFLPKICSENKAVSRSTPAKVISLDINIPNVQLTSFTVRHIQPRGPIENQEHPLDLSMPSSKKRKEYPIKNLSRTVTHDAVSLKVIDRPPDFELNKVCVKRIKLSQKIRGVVEL